jgi:hypothetical protein
MLHEPPDGGSEDHELTDKLEAGESEEYASVGELLGAQDQSNEEEEDMEGGMNMGIDPNLLLAKMDNGRDDDKTLWLFLLLLLYGRRGFGGQDDGGGVRSPATLADLNAAQNAVGANILDINRDIAASSLRNETGQQTIQQIMQRCCADLLKGQCDVTSRVDAAAFALANGQKDLCKNIADCCCQLGISIKDVERAVADCCCQLGIGQKELQNALERCCCETQNQLQMGFAGVQNAICKQTFELGDKIHAEAEATRALITQNRMDDLQRQLEVCRDELSNERQTQQIAAIVRDQCGHHHWGRGGGGYEYGPPWGPPAAATTGKK